MTIAFFGDEDPTSCAKNDISKGLVFTTNTIPYSFTCFNISDIFTQNNKTSGTTNASLHIGPPEALPYPNYVNWSVSNLDIYDANSVYSRVWYNQQPVGSHEGDKGHWVLWLYAFADCKQNGGDDYAIETWPWFSTSCTTKEGGQCRALQTTIKSFALNQAEEYNTAHKMCQTWAKMGAATRSGRLSLSWFGMPVVAALFSLL